MCVEGAEWAWWIRARLEDRIQAIYGKEALMDIGRSAVVGVEILVGDIIDIRSEQIAKELGKHFIMIVFGIFL